MNRSSLVRGVNIGAPCLLLLAALVAAATEARSEERDKSSALAAKLHEEQPLPRGEYVTSEAKRAAEIDQRFDAIEKLLSKLDERLAAIDLRLEKHEKPTKSTKP